MAFGAVWSRAAARRARRWPTIDWSDAAHALLVVVDRGCAIAAYQPLGFIVTMSLLVFALLVIVERRNLLPPPPISIGAHAVRLLAVRHRCSRPPLERGVLWF